VVKKEDYKEPT